MNQWDYARGYDEGKEDAYNTSYRPGLLMVLLRLVFFFLSLLVKLCFFIVAMLLAFIWAIIRRVTALRRPRK